jgi:hypothetical protein
MDQTNQVERVESRICRYCNTSFNIPVKRGRKKDYCSKPCQVRAYYRDKGIAI